MLYFGQKDRFLVIGILDLETLSRICFEKKKDFIHYIPKKLIVRTGAQSKANSRKMFESRFALNSTIGQKTTVDPLFRLLPPALTIAGIT